MDIVIVVGKVPPDTSGAPIEPVINSCCNLWGEILGLKASDLLLVKVLVCTSRSLCVVW